MLELTVKTLDSQNHSFTVPDETTVRQLKESILEKIEVPVEIQRLIFHGKVLQDEKKLTDYGDVHGKVIHLVQRPPPPPTRPSNGNNSTESNQRASSRRSQFSSRDRIDGGSSTYLGALTFSPDLIDTQGIQLPPSQRLSRRRLLVAQRMLNQAGNCITALENPEGQQAFSAESQEPLANSSSAQSNTPGNGREEADMFLGETTGSIARAAQAATAAAIAAAVSAAHAVVVPHITIRGASGQNDTPLSNLDNSNPNMSDINLNLNIDDNHPEDVAVEVEIGANSDVSVDECHDGDSIANNLDNNPSGSNVAPPRSNVERTSAFAALIEQLEEQQRKFQGLLRRCHQLMVDDPPLTENSSPNAEECQRLFNGVSETMHYFAHAYHALSDIMVDFNEDTPRTLRCRPVLISHSAVLETIFPIQGQINLSTHRHTNESGTNLSGSEPSQPSVNINVVNAQTRADPVNSGNSNTSPQNTAETPQQERGEENVTPHDSTSSFSSTATQQSEERSQSSQSGGINNTSGFFLSAPGNLEVFMDFRPESVTLGSVETTVILDNEARSRNNSGSGGIQLRNLGESVFGNRSVESIQRNSSGRTPIALMQALQNHVMSRINQSARGDQPPPYDVNVQESASETVMSNPSATFQPHSSASSESTTTSPNVSNSRPYVHVGQAIPDVALNSYDPFLPCNSHHIRANRNQSRNSNSQGATARNTGETANASANSERVNLIRVRPRQGTPNNTTGAAPPAANSSTSRSPRQNNQTTGQPSFIPLNLRNFTQTTLPNSPPMGWLMSGTRASPGSMRDFLDFFRRLNSNAGGGGQNTLPGNTIAEFLSAIDNSYIEGESIVSDFFMTLARNLTWQDVAELSMAQRTMVESIVARLHPALQTFVFQRLLQGEAPSEENIARACERIYSELRPYLDVLQEARLRESVDLVATINNFNQSQIPEIVELVVETPPIQSENFGQTMTRRVRNYMRQLIAIIIHCCQDGVQGFDAIVQNCVRLFTRGIPEYIQQWTEINSVNNLRYFTATLNVPLEDIQHYLVYRIPSSTMEKSEPAGNIPEPMETDSTQNRTVGATWVQPEGMQSPEKVEEPITDSLVDALDAENLPDVLIGSETWHNGLPSEWVPIIARDTQRQRRQSSQKPFSDAYLAGLPPKRRKLITSAKPQGSLSQVISDGVRQAITAAGVSSTAAERAIVEAGKDDVLQEAYKEQERLVVSADLRKDPDFTASRFPNAFKYFDK